MTLLISLEPLVQHKLTLDEDVIVLGDEENFININVAPNLADDRDDRVGLNMRNHVAGISPVNKLW